MQRTGIFVGSFDPFTTGHHAIVSRALPLFDRIVIGVGFNERKKYMYSAQTRVKAIARLYADEPKVEVKEYSDLTVDSARTPPSFCPCPNRGARQRQQSLRQPFQTAYRGLWRPRMQPGYTLPHAVRQVFRTKINSKI